MATTSRDRTATEVEGRIRRIRDLNERIADAAREGGSEALDAYERLLEDLAGFEEEVGARSAEWIRSMTRAQAAFTRELAGAFPSAARRLGGQFAEFASAAARQAREVPGVATTEGEVRGAVASERDLPIARYDELSVDEIGPRLERLSKTDLAKVEAYEHKHKGRKTVLEKVEALR